ncbi:MAG: lipopolysaccharide heptosyltransferase II [Candidatus Hydrogenedentota bacterium]
MTDNPIYIAVYIPNWLGDVAMCTPALRTLHARYPDSEMAVIGRGAACSLLKGLPFIKRFITIPERPGFIAMMALGRQIRPYARDLAVVFPHSFRAAFLARVAGSKRIVGYDRGNRKWLFTDTVEPYREGGKISPVYMTWEYLDLLAPLDTNYDGFGLELRADERAVAGIREHIVGGGPLIGFAPGAAFGPSKQWPVERFATVADKLYEEVGARCVLLTGPGEEETRAAFLELTHHPVIICDEGNPTVDTLKASISVLDLLVCNDSGPRHVAIAFNVPTVCIMGSTRPVYSEGPYEKGEVVRIDVDCGPCQKPICTTDHRCMTGVEPQRVVEAVLHHL